jgi:hypothetical protein
MNKKPRFIELLEFQKELVSGVDMFDINLLVFIWVNLDVLMPDNTTMNKQDVIIKEYDQ